MCHTPGRFVWSRACAGGHSNTGKRAVTPQNSAEVQLRHLLRGRGTCHQRLSPSHIASLLASAAFCALAAATAQPPSQTLADITPITTDPLYHAKVIKTGPTRAAGVADTIFLEVGSPLVNGTVFKPHRARVRVYGADGTTLTNEWINKLTLGDSAGRKIMRWVTSSQPIATNPNRPIMDLRQTYDAVTLAPYGYLLKVSNGVATRLTINGRAVRGTRRTLNDTTVHTVSVDLDRAGFVASASDLVPVAAGMTLGAVIVAPEWGPNMQKAEDRVFTGVKDTVVRVEGTPQKSRKVEERRRSDRAFLAAWYLTLASPYMVYGEVPLPNGGVQRMTEVPLPMAGKKP